MEVSRSLFAGEIKLSPRFTMSPSKRTDLHLTAMSQVTTITVSAIIERFYMD